MKQFPVSVIIPTYCPTEQHVIWLDKCVHSVIQANAEDIVVFDDGSPLFLEVQYTCQKYGLDYYGVKLNRGPSYARNRAVERARNDLILPIDCDDWVHPDTIRLLYEAWDGTPLIPDVVKVFQDGSQKVHRLQEWSCEAQYQVLGIASVSVLHSVEQWQEVGGWDESLKAKDLYEDCEYNARLFFHYCASNCRHPVIYYRQHDESRVKMYRDSNNTMAMMNRIRAMGNGNMAKSCCGRRTVIKQMQPKAQFVNGGAPMAQDVNSMAETSGTKVLVQYVGGEGKLTHVYRGPVTKEGHKVVQNQYLYVDPQDAVDDKSQMGTSLFVRVNKPKPKPVTTKQTRAKTSEPVVESKPVVKRTARDSKKEKKPVK